MEYAPGLVRSQEAEACMIEMPGSPQRELEARVTLVPASDLIAGDLPELPKDLPERLRKVIANMQYYYHYD